MTTAKSTPAPAGVDVEQAARAAREVADRLYGGDGLNGLALGALGMTRKDLAAYGAACYVEGRNAAATDRAALARANGLLTRCYALLEQAEPNATITDDVERYLLEGSKP